MNDQQKRRSGRKLLTWLALLLLAGSAYCWFRARARHDQAPVDVEVPLHLADGANLNVPLSIPGDRNCEAQIQYPKLASTDVWKDLQELKGTASLSKDGKMIAESAMPTEAMSGDRSHVGIMLFRFKSANEGQYSLSLKVDHVPVGLTNVEGRVKIQNDFRRYKDVIGLTILSETLGVLAILIIIPVTYSWLRSRSRRT